MRLLLNLTVAFLMLYPRGIATEKLPLFAFDLAVYNCVMEALWFEARSEPEAGIAAVLSVIANRKQHKGYPDDYCEVIRQPKQFSYRNNYSDKSYWDSKSYRNKWSGKSYRDGISGTTKINGKNIAVRYYFSEIPKLLLVQDYAHRAATGSFKPTLDNSVISYHNTTVAPRWVAKMRFNKKIGKHLFYSERKSS